MKADGSNAPTTVRKQDTIGGLIEKLTPQIEKALPKHITPDRMARLALTAIRQNQKLQQIASDNPTSILASVMIASQLGLEPNTPLGQCYIIPYGAQAQFQIGYKGILDLAHRSQQFKRISAYAVDEADEFTYQYGMEPTLHHVPARKPTGNAVYYYAVYELTNGGKDFKVWSREAVDVHAKQYSQAYKAQKKDSPWFTAFDQMAKKTVLIDLLRYAPKSIEMQTAVQYDNASVSVRAEDPELEIRAEWEPVIDDHDGE